MIEILYVDDEKALLEIGKEFLERSRELHVDTANSVPMALKKLGLRRYDAIVSDYQMPGTDGLQFLKSLRSSGKTVPFILFTGKGREEVVIEALNSGADFYLQKGGMPEAQYRELEHSIKAAVQRHSAEESVRLKNEELQALNQQLAVAEEELRQQLDVVTMAQSDLKKEMTFSRSLIESLPGIFYVFDVQTERLVRWNVNHNELLDTSIEQLSLKHISDWFRPEDKSLLRSKIWECLSTGQVKVEVPLIENSGRETPYLLTGKRFDWLHHTYIVGVGLNINERKKFENDLRESEELFHTIMDNMRDVVTVIDLDLKYTYVSPSIKNLRGYTAEEVMNQTMDMVMTPRSLERVEWMFAEEMRLIAEGKKDVYRLSYLELEEYRKDGSTVWVGNNLSFITDKDGNPRAVIAVAYDITDRKKNEEALRESETRFDLLAEHSGTITWDVDVNGVFTYISRLSEPILGYRPEELVGKMHFYDLVPEPEREMIKNRALSAFGKKVKIASLECQIVTKQGQVRWASINGFPLLGPDGSMKGYRGNTTDINDIKKAEFELRMANRKLSLLSSMTRHDIINQIMAVRGNLELAKIKNPTIANSEHIAKAVRALDQINAVVQFTKVYEDIGVREPKWHDVRLLITSASIQTPLNLISIIDDVPAGTEIYADPLIQNVFFNLIDNAVRYGGKLTHIRFYSIKGEGNHFIVCEDDGVGISNDMKGRLFEQGCGKGHGLGLFLSREILSITGIKIEERGETGKGAKFILIVPSSGIRTPCCNDAMEMMSASSGLASTTDDAATVRPGAGVANRAP